MSDLQRFTKAQKEDFNLALEEIRRGRKRSHWMWYIFPQIRGLGFSSMSAYYGKLLSSMTLFEGAEGKGGVFTKVIEKYYGGRRDQRTLELLGITPVF